MVRLWIDLANSPHVPFFRALMEEFVARGAQIEFTARDFAETIPLAKAAGLSPHLIGGYGGRRISGKAGNLSTRAWALARWAKGRGFDLAIGHNSYSQILAARALRLKNATLMDYEYQPANHLAFRLSSRIIVPESFPARQLQHYGARAAKVRRYAGIKEDVYLANFRPDPLFITQLCELGISPDNVLVLMRPPAHDALYHRFQNELFDEAVAALLTHANIKIILLPRNEAQYTAYSSRAHPNLIVPSKPLDGPNLIAASDLVISGGGTINREAAALGIPTASIYAGQWAAVDEGLRQQGRLRRIGTRADLESIRVEKKSRVNARDATEVRSKIAELILSN